MFALIKTPRSLACVLVALSLHLSTSACVAQTDDSSLFVIQRPLKRSPRSGTTLVAAFPASAKIQHQTPTFEAPPAPTIQRKDVQQVKFRKIVPFQVEDDDLIREIKALDASLAEEGLTDGDEEPKVQIKEEDEDEDLKDVDQLIKESLDEDSADEAEDGQDQLKLESSPEETPAANSVTTWSLKPMSLIRPSIRPPSGESPQDQSWQLTSRNSLPLAASRKLYAWAAPNIKHNPLYFEDVALERYGQNKGLVRQPIASGIHFLKSAALLPYFSLYDPINSCDGPLGYCRPGSPVCCSAPRHFFGNPFRR